MMPSFSLKLFCSKEKLYQALSLQLQLESSLNFIKLCPFNLNFSDFWIFSGFYKAQHVWFYNLCYNLNFIIVLYFNHEEGSSYNNIVPIGANEGEMSITTKCRTLILIGSNIPPNTSLWFWKCFTFLDTLYIWECDSLIYWPEEEFRSLNCLRVISVIGCPNFLGSQLQSQVGRSTIEVSLPKLQDLIIARCPNLVEIPKCSTSIQQLYISECPKLQCLPEWLGSMIALKWLPVIKCESLTSLPRSIGGLASLEMLWIEECPKIRVLPQGMEGLKTLKMLRIEKCPKIRVLPEGLLQQLKNLNELWIEGCPHLERHFRKYGKYQHLISEIRIKKIGEERRYGIIKELALSFPSCKITCFSARS